MKFVGLSLVILSYVAAAISDEASPEIIPIDGGVSGSGTTVRYWDCCKVTCGWTANSNTAKPIASCAKDGVTEVDSNTQSGCAGGAAYTCTNDQPQVINSTLAYGFAAASFVGGTENMCCSCVLLEFQGDLAGKSMIVQLSNTAVDANSTANNFNLQLPGGGTGYYEDACAEQWDTTEDIWGDQYGGVETEAGCEALPEALQEGCKFRFDFMQGVSNPAVTFYQVKCPAELLAVSGCQTDA